ncbi:MAG: hypothetical protein HY006_01900 [Candidatus Sungbacteria bacterium]|nr:hypothetical protein [Candidatus Sungbacteria bacterium]
MQRSKIVCYGLEILAQFHEGRLVRKRSSGSRNILLHRQIKAHLQHERCRDCRKVIDAFNVPQETRRQSIHDPFVALAAQRNGSANGHPASTTTRVASKERSAL